MVLYHRIKSLIWNFQLICVKLMVTICIYINIRQQQNSLKFSWGFIVTYIKFSRLITQFNQSNWVQVGKEFFWIDRHKVLNWEPESFKMLKLSKFRGDIIRDWAVVFKCRIFFVGKILDEVTIYSHLLLVRSDPPIRFCYDMHNKISSNRWWQIKFFLFVSARID